MFHKRAKPSRTTKSSFIVVVCVVWYSLALEDSSPVTDTVQPLILSLSLTMA